MIPTPRWALEYPKTLLKYTVPNPNARDFNSIYLERRNGNLHQIKWRSGPGDGDRSESLCYVTVSSDD